MTDSPDRPFVAEADVLRHAADLGFALLAVSPAQPADHQDFFRHWLAQGRHGDMDYLAADVEQRLDPAVLVPGARSIICAIDRYPHQPPAAFSAAAPVGRIARYAWGDDYHRVMKKRLHRLADRLRPHYPGHTFRTTVDSAPIMERQHHQRAGLGWIGKHTLLIHPRLGSWFLLGCVVTTLDIQPDPRRQPILDHCGQCTRCIDACPTQCISPYQVDASRCISYLTIEHRGAIDADLQRAMGNWVAGCDVCQEVCPFNQALDTERLARELPPTQPAYDVRPPGPATPLLELLNWDAPTRQQALQRSALKRIKLEMMKRNALIAARNHLREQDDPALGRLVQQVAREHGPLPVRGIYLATHFGNWYANAPLPEVCRHIRELAERGTNHLMVWMDLSNHDGYQAATTRVQVERLRALLATGRDAGMKVGLARVANESWRNSPVNCRADRSGGRGAVMISDVCPSHPDGIREIQRNAEQVYGWFDALDFTVLWPYDSGGCACPSCRPWGSRGFLAAAAVVGTRFRRQHPTGQIILSTWFMDESEWAGVRQAFDAGRLEWVDAILAEHFWKGLHPEDLRRGDVPRGLPLLGFPEISMAGMEPWGGCGANPRPAALEDHWRRCRPWVQGGFPYSEGIYEDVNKAVMLGFYRQPDRPVESILRDYVARELSPDVVTEGVEMIQAMERTLPRKHLVACRLDEAGRVWELAQRIDERLPAPVRAGWRWRLLYLRARIDGLLAQGADAATPALLESMDELHRLYHTNEDTLLGWLMPPVVRRQPSPAEGNLAAAPGAAVQVSSCHPDRLDSASALVDDILSVYDPDNYWSSHPDDPAPTAQLDLGQSAAVGDVAIQFRPRPGSNGWYRYHAAPTSVTIEVSRDGQSWERVVDASADVPADTDLYKQWFVCYPVRRDARYLRLIFGRSRCTEAGSEGAVQIAEIRVFRAP